MRFAIVFLIALAAIGAGTARADEVKDAVTKLLATGGETQVLVEFDLQRIDGRGGQEVKLQGTLVGKDGLVLVTGAKQVDPPVGGNLAKPTKIEVRFPGDEKRTARFVGKDDELNLALIRIEANGDETVALPVAGFRKGAELTPGQMLIVLKRLPRVDDDLLTFGLLRVSAVIPRPGLPMEYRVLGSLNGYEGCPVYSVDASLVGYVSAATRTRGRGRGFRIVNGRLVPNSGGGRGSGRSGHPTRILAAGEIRTFLSDPTKFARRDCWLGVKGLQALTRPLAEAYGIEKPGGLVIGEISGKSPAEGAGLLAGDVIVALDGEAVATLKDRDVASFSRKIRRAKAGDSVSLTVLRRGEEGFAERSVAVVLEESPLGENEVPEYHDETFGLKLKPLTRDFLERSRLSLDSTGVRVTAVDPASWAFLAGMRSGDVIQKMVLKPCEDLEQYKKIMADLLKSRDSEVCYNVMRSRKSVFLCVRPDWKTVVEVK